MQDDITYSSNGVWIVEKFSHMGISGNFIINFLDADCSENQNRDIHCDKESSDGTKNPANE